MSAALIFIGIILSLVAFFVVGAKIYVNRQVKKGI
jgi:uncharacterized protein YneF (UPF0154 family)